MARALALVVLVAATITLGGAGAAPTADVYLYVKSSGYYGAVELNPAGTQVGECTTYCKFAFPVGTVVRLTAQRTYTSVSFVGWSQLFQNWTPPCGGTSTVCTVTMNQSLAVRAQFSPVALRLLAGDGGTAAMFDARWSCGSNCGLYDYGAQARVRATELPGNAFVAWSGGCAGIGRGCRFRITDNRLLVAIFRCTEDVCSITQPVTTKVRFYVRVVGSGRVTGAGINCSSTCYRDVGVADQLSLQAQGTPRSWAGQGFRCAAGSPRCTFRVTKGSSSSSPGLIVSF